MSQEKRGVAVPPSSYGFPVSEWSTCVTVNANRSAAPLKLHVHSPGRWQIYKWSGRNCVSTIYQQFDLLREMSNLSHKCRYLLSVWSTLCFFLLWFEMAWIGSTSYVNMSQEKEELPFLRAATAVNANRSAAPLKLRVLVPRPLTNV